MSLVKPNVDKTQIYRIKGFRTTSHQTGIVKSIPFSKKNGSKIR
jgi:hypothetical protein